MISLDIVIPTKNRIKKLENCINSIFLGAKVIPISLWLYFSIQEEFDYFREVFQNIDEVHLEMLKEYRVPNFWNAHLNKMTADIMIYANDDLLFEEDTLQVISEEYPKMFPNFDGVMGLRQTNLPQDQALEGAFGVIGKNYIQRFPIGQVWCLNYHRFYADRELWLYAKSIGKFYFCTTARITHLHPATNRNLEDDTHKDVRKYLSLDRDTFQKRQEQGWLWGRDFNLINEP